jgi:acetolactate synthase-1/2/3 large subunit
MKIRVADFIAKYLADNEFEYVFLVTGGGAMHLNDAFAKERRITPIFNHHEQASSMGAEGYARIKNKPAVINVTTGPGCLNALNGVFGAWTDSIPMLVLSGQVKRETKKSRVEHLKLRQLGDQEVDIINVAKPITKYIASLDNPEDVKYVLQKALYEATHGRPGPTWIDIPVDVQGALVEVNELKSFTPYEPVQNLKLLNDIKLIIQKIKEAKRPVILSGNGVRLSNSIDLFFELSEKLKIPICSAWMMDYIPADYLYFSGIQGTVGDRAGNFVVQNSDLVLILGSRLQIRQVSYNWENFARKAFKIHVDIDQGELDKPTLNSDLRICTDLRRFISLMVNELNDYQPTNEHTKWSEWAKSRKERYFPVTTNKHRKFADKINPYHFFDVLSEKLDSNWNIVAGNASACLMSFPVIKIKHGMRMFTNAGSASMGYDLPAAIGAALADKTRNTLCIAGDGSIMMNLQELQTVVQMKLPLKIIILNNNGYLSIRSTQTNLFNQKFGESPDSGLTIPDFVKIGSAFGIRSKKITSIHDIHPELDRFLHNTDAQILEVVVDGDQFFEPKLSSKKTKDGKMITAPLEDMFPFLERTEFHENMIIDPLEVRKNDVE